VVSGEKSSALSPSNSEFGSEGSNEEIVTMERPKEMLLQELSIASSGNTTNSSNDSVQDLTTTNPIHRDHTSYHNVPQHLSPPHHVNQPHHLSYDDKTSPVHSEGSPDHQNRSGHNSNDSSPPSSRECSPESISPLSSIQGSPPNVGSQILSSNLDHRFVKDLKEKLASAQLRSDQLPNAQHQSSQFNHEVGLPIQCK